MIQRWVIVFNHPTLKIQLLFNRSVESCYHKHHFVLNCLIQKLKRWCYYIINYLLTFFRGNGLTSFVCNVNFDSCVCFNLGGFLSSDRN
jgi:hypothetical protein